MSAWVLHLFAVGPLPLTSTSRPPDITHVMNETRPSLFFCAFPLQCYIIILNANRRTKRGRPRNEANNCVCHIHSGTKKFDLAHRTVSC